MSSPRPYHTIFFPLGTKNGMVYFFNCLFMFTTIFAFLLFYFFLFYKDIVSILWFNCTYLFFSSFLLEKAARSGIHWKDYHDLDVIYSFMREIRGKFPNISRLYTIGKTAEGRDLKVLRWVEKNNILHIKASLNRKRILNVF